MGFPSPAEDYREDRIDLNQYLVARPSSTFFFRVKGNSMEKVIPDGALVAVDRSLKAKHSHIILAVLEGEFTIRRLIISNTSAVLQPENPSYKSTVVTSETDLLVWGVVVGCVIKFY